MYIKLKDLLASFCWTNKQTIQVCLDLILYPITNLHSCSIRTLIDVLAEILDSSQSSRNFYIDMTIKEKKKLRTVRNHVLIGKPGSIAFKNQAIVRPSIEWTSLLELNGVNMSYYSTKEAIINQPEEHFLLLLKDL